MPALHTEQRRRAGAEAGTRAPPLYSPPFAPRSPPSSTAPLPAPLPLHPATAAQLHLSEDVHFALFISMILYYGLVSISLLVLLKRLQNYSDAERYAAAVQKLQAMWRGGMQRMKAPKPRILPMPPPCFHQRVHACPPPAHPRTHAPTHPPSTSPARRPTAGWPSCRR